MNLPSKLFSSSPSPLLYLLPTSRKATSSLSKIFTKETLFSTTNFAKDWVKSKIVKKQSFFL